MAYDDDSERDGSDDGGDGRSCIERLDNAAQEALATESLRSIIDMCNAMKERDVCPICAAGAIVELLLKVTKLGGLDLEGAAHALAHGFNHAYEEAGATINMVVQIDADHKRGMTH